MRIPVDLRDMKPQAVDLLSKMLAPSGPEAIGPRLGSFLRDLQGQIDAVADSDGVGALVLELAGLSDDDVHRLGLRLRCVQDALLDCRPGLDKPFLQLLAGLRAACANEQMLRDVSAGRLSVAGPAIEEDDDL